MPLSIIIPYRNGAATIERLLDSLPNDLPVIVVDDQSEVPYQSNRANVRVIRGETRGYFSGAVNLGISECDTDVLILNQDVWLEGAQWLEEINQVRESVACYGDGVFSNPAWKNGYCQGTFMFLWREAINQVGLLDARDYPLWGATAEWQLRACRRGFAAKPAQVPGLHHLRGKENYGSAISQTLKEEPELKAWLIRTPPAISVVIAAKNYGHFLSDALHSLVGGKTFMGDFQPQTFQSFEVILVDYGSYDNTWNIMQGLANPWRGIHAIQVLDEGTAEACNAGIRASHGKYIAMLDADDLMEANRLEKMYRLAESNPHKVIFDDLRMVIDSKRGEHWNYPDYDFDQILEKNTMHKGLLFPREAWEEVGGYPKIMSDGREDWAFNIALGLKGWCGEHLREPLYLARRSTHNRSSKNTNPLWHQKFMEKLHYLFPQAYEGERPMGCCGGNKSRKWKGTRPGVTRTLPATRDGDLPGADGMVKVEYLLALRNQDQHDLRPYPGKETGTVYYFGKLRTRGYIDAKDAKGFCEFMGGAAFRLWTP